MATGQTRPTVRDAIAAATVLARFDPGPEVRHEDYIAAFTAYHETVADVLSPHQFAVLSQRFADHPVLQRLSAEWEAANM